ncbi:HD-domain/PDEase-like protein [Exidia glandulosa HHB12029]|uniref:HD-domain/PDEase-like protein n=1 Tax=Exidia glandulosa HHB12029 TaxID=1314781 RepID=A0A165ZP86_EXIGL|nr:HD-domain/PDEase-like protein [Exidia glandulosa HHB12029]
MASTTSSTYDEKFAESYNTYRRIKDPIHGYITVSPEIVKYIDTPQFQRLRNVKQLGTSYHVWPGAAHNRFEHCLGVAHLCERIVTTLQQAQPGLGITERDKFCVQLAGLCHDLGHGPFSHVFDGQFMPAALQAKGVHKSWEHEEGSELMFDALIDENEIDISDEDRNFVKDLIRGERRLSNVPDEKMFLFEIVANKRNGIDVDKLDYIARDSWAVEDQPNTSALRLIDSARVLEGHICYHIKDANSVYYLFHTRFSLHKRIYNHKTSSAIAYMLVDAFLSAEPVLHLSDRVYDARQFRFLTDAVVTEIEQSKDNQLEQAQAIIDRIHRRKLYRTVDFTCLPWSYGTNKTWIEGVTCENIVKHAKRLCLESEDDDPDLQRRGEELKSEHVIVDWSCVHWGMKNSNPIDKVEFYGKYGNTKPKKATPEDLTHLLPSSFGEYHLRVYTRESKFFGIVQAGFRDLLKQLPHPPAHPEIHDLRNDDDATVHDPDLANAGDKTPVQTPAELPRSIRTPPLSREGSMVVGAPVPATPRPKKSSSGTPPDALPSLGGSQFMSTPMNFNSHPEPPPSPTRRPQKAAVQASATPGASRGTKRGREADDPEDAALERSRSSSVSGGTRKSARLSSK